MLLGTFFDPQFWQQFVTTIAGVILGIPAALWIERKLEWRRTTGERKELVQALLDALNKNLSLVQQLSKELTLKGDHYTPLYPVDLTILDATATRRYELLADVTSARSVDDARFELIHLNGKLILLRETAATKGLCPFYVGVRNSIRQHLPHVQEAVLLAIRRLDHGKAARQV